MSQRRQHRRHDLGRAHIEPVAMFASIAISRERFR